jgi:two-component system nitrate/nitrite response regulator NarL
MAALHGRTAEWWLNTGSPDQERSRTPLMAPARPRADGHPLILLANRASCRAARLGWSARRTATEALDAARRARDLPCSACSLGLTGLEVLEAITAGAAARVCSPAGRPAARTTSQAGAAGVLEKDATPDDRRRAAADRRGSRARAVRAGGAGERVRRGDPAKLLSARELDVPARAARGSSPGRRSPAAHVSPSTVKTHLQRLCSGSASPTARRRSPRACGAG